MTPRLNQDNLQIYYIIHLRNKGMFESLTQQVFTWESAAVFIPLGFGLLVGLVYVFISATRHKKGT